MSNRIQVHRRRFAYKVGCTFVGVWELMSVSPILRLHRYKRLSFAFEADCSCGHVDRKRIREEILRRLRGSNETQAS